MNRRQLLTGLAASHPLVVAGCVGGNDPTVPAEIEVETYYLGSIIFRDTETIWNRLDPHETPQSYQTVFTDRATAVEQLRKTGAVETFLHETDFGQSFIVAITAGYWSGDFELTLSEVERTKNGLHMDINAISPVDDQLGDYRLHSLTIRVTDEKVESPDEVSIAIEGEQTGVAGSN